MKCRICNSDLVLIHIGTRDKENINVLECVNCHTKQLSTVGNNDYENGFMNGKISMTDDEISRRLDSCLPDDLRRATFMKTMTAGKSLLDFGCGFGGFLSKWSELENGKGKWGG